MVLNFLLSFQKIKGMILKRSLVLLFFFFGMISVSAQFLEGKKNLKTYSGLFNFHYSEAEGSIYLEVENLNEEFLYVHSLTTGLGSNDIGLDRGQLGDGVIVKFVKTGNKLLLIQPNQNYRAITDNSLEKRSVEQAFAKSVLFGFPIKETKDNTYIIDITPFLMLDAHHVTQRLKRGKEGTYKYDKSRSALWLENTKAFPKNVEFEAMLTFVGQATGRNIRTVAPDASSITVIQHHSFVELPDNNYKKRIFDTRSGSYPFTYKDYSTPIWEPINKKFIFRHRLEKKNPDAAISEAVEPIIYYLDNGTPEPIRSALLDGARWWNEAFEAIGYKDAFQVKMLPDDADPMDLRYNVIQWVHRSTRGWSYGGSISDPRTGEIIKGHVSLGSLRIRQDFLIAQALMNQPFANDSAYQPMLEMALARLRQLAAHEVGHTIGFTHNFAASTNGRASVMDYPHPMLSIQNGEIIFNDAYDVGIGDWDKVTVAYSYTDLPKNKPEIESLRELLDNAYAKGLRFISDSDARAQGGAHILAHLWDNGENVTDELEQVLLIRKKAIENFSINNIRTGEPYSVLEDVFVPLYFFHRYQTEAVVKRIGGLDYNYAVKGDNQLVVETLSSKEQRRAVRVILNTIDANTLAIPKEKLALFPPRAFGYNRTRESFKGLTGVSFDAIGVSATASDMTLGLLLHPERASRLVQQKSLDKNQLGLDELLDELIKNTIQKKQKDAYLSEVQFSINYNVVKHLMNLSVNKKSSPRVKQISFSTLKKVVSIFKNDIEANSFLINEITNFIKSPEKFKEIKSPAIPDGSPIGSFQCFFTE